VRDAADEIRKALALLTRDVALVLERAAKVESHFDRARGEVDALGVAAARAQGRAARLEALEFDDEDLPAAAAAAPGDNRAGPLILRG
jgi:DNA recombination protein RmuC